VEEVLLLLLLLRVVRGALVEVINDDMLCVSFIDRLYSIV
jgi:hypothetical protein